MKKILLGILKGGSSKERDVSFMTAKKIVESLNTELYDFVEIEVPKDKKDTGWIEALFRIRPQLVLSALHGGMGENGCVQGLLQCMNIKYIGSGVLGSAIGMNKHLAKILMRSQFIPVPDDVLICNEREITDYIEKIHLLGLPIVVKPNNGGSSIDLSIVDDYSNLEKAIRNVLLNGDEALIEKFIEGQEVTCGVVEKNGELTVTSVLDIGTTDGVYDYDAKYADVFRTKIEFSLLPDFLQTMIQEIAKKTFRILKCKGYGRIDMIVSEEQIYVLEINTLPGMTSFSLIPRAVEGGGMKFGSFLDVLIENALMEK